MARSLASKPNVQAPAPGSYPYGRIKDNSGINDGTPIDEEVYGDFHQFFARLLARTNVTANGLPENGVDGFQYNEALEKLINGEILSVTANTSLTSSHFNWTIIGNSASAITVTLPPATVADIGKRVIVYNVNTGAVTTAPDGTDNIAPVLAADNVIYNSDCIIYECVQAGGWIIKTLSRSNTLAVTPSFSNSWTAFATVQYKSEGGMTHLKGTIQNTYDLAIVGAVIFTLTKAPLTQKSILVNMIESGTGTIYPCRLIIETNGDVKFTNANFFTSPTNGDTIQIPLDGISFFNHI